MIDLEKIYNLLKSNATAYDIEMKTGISRSNITNYRNQPGKVKKMSIETAIKLQAYYEEELEMNYENELKQLAKEDNYSVNVMIFENKEALLTALSENADEPEETYEYMKKELSNLADDNVIYEVDKNTGVPKYFDDAKEAYDSI